VAAQIMGDVEAGLTLEQVAARNWQEVYTSQEGCEARWALLGRGGYWPFDRYRTEAIVDPESALEIRNPAFMLRKRPFAWSSTGLLMPRRVDGRWVVVVQPDGELRFTLSPAVRNMICMFGIHPLAWENARGERTDGVRFSLELEHGEGPPIVLHERTLDPASEPGDRGLQQFHVLLPDQTEGTIVLRTGNAPGRSATMDWSYWAEYLAW
jgi:hypothetical protein